ncbi:DUF2269 family protein [Brevundimonas viscosa]|uniref:Uncharacterized membrane protein n=1 Tax=Brevundimonas viscosa TaxID=871741 RepID=A0A1I6SFK5_9CAUL|nr:DUF2269 domain-containing protein [Brevundimonas viscosa]SFS75766.1 Uncharacterized membrane protein [Brevundimonas viscosa]
MIDAYVLLKLVHILSAAVLFGTGAGIAFFMVRARRTRDPSVAAAVGRMVVLADFLFTATAVVVQPLSGLALIRLQGYRLDEPWLLASYALFLLVGACWLPVVWIQQRLARLAAAAADAGAPLPPAYDRLYRIWFVLGWPAFAGVIGIYVLMLSRPSV